METLFNIYWKKFLCENQELDEVSILKNKNPFKALFILGPAGAGKSFVSKQIGIPADFKISNPDERIEAVFPVFGISLKFADSNIDPEKVGLEMLQQQSRNILQNANIGHTGNLLAIASPAIFDTTGEDTAKTGNKMHALTELGYDVAVIVINVPPVVSVARDQSRQRTVGAQRTATISNDFQDKVVLGHAYPKIAKTNKNVTILGDVYPNVFDLKTGHYLEGIDSEMLKSLPQFIDATPENAKQILMSIRTDLQKWLSNGVQNERGQLILSAMKNLVKISKGRMGQNMNDLIMASKITDNETIKKAAELLTHLGSTISRATGSKKPTGPTIRQATGALGKPTD